MSKPCIITTSDPRFDPNEPVTINGYRFVPAEREMAVAAPVPQLPGRRNKIAVEVRRRRLAQRSSGQGEE